MFIIIAIVAFDANEPKGTSNIAATHLHNLLTKEHPSNGPTIRTAFPSLSKDSY